MVAKGQPTTCKPLPVLRKSIRLWPIISIEESVVGRCGLTVLANTNMKEDNYIEKFSSKLEIALQVVIQFLIRRSIRTNNSYDLDSNEQNFSQDSIVYES